MAVYEYKVIPAPAKGRKASGIKGPEARFAHALEYQFNELAVEGWEYQRADILPSEERQGLTSSHTVYRSVLVFRRELAAGEPLGEVPAEPDEEPIKADEPLTEEPGEENAEPEAAPETEEEKLA